MSLDQEAPCNHTPSPSPIGGFDDEKLDVATVACLHGIYIYLYIYMTKLLTCLLRFSDVTSLSKNSIFEVSKDKQI